MMKEHSETKRLGLKEKLGLNVDRQKLENSLSETNIGADFLCRQYERE